MTDDTTPSTKQAEKRAGADLLSHARRQLAGATEEFQHGLSKITDRGRRLELTASYLDLLQNYLGKAQLKLTRYRGKLQLQRDDEQSAARAEDDESAAVAEVSQQVGGLPRPSLQRETGADT